MAEPNIYLEVQRAVIWGQSREEVYAIMAGAGITGQLADGMFNKAWGERVAIIRGEASARAVKGALILAGGLGLFFVFWYVVGAITRNIFIISGVACLWGGWWLLDGLMNWILAPGRQGSVTSMD
jgi:hypothetical protein